MRVAILHYHLRRGGVSRVIEHSISSLKNKGVDVVAMVGELPQDDAIPHDQIKVVEGIDYASEDGGISAEEMAAQLEKAAMDHFGAAPDVWHFHNHAIDKNCALTEAVSILARRGHHILLQIHDFAEDGRPHLFKEILKDLGQGNIEGLGELMYPQATHIHYATINSRDLNLLASLGISRKQLHLIPNAVTLESTTSTEWDADPKGERFILYPIRAIRRKNVGEFLLWVALAQDDERFAVTLAPTSAHDRFAYEHWIDFAQRHKLPVEFEVGLRHDMPFAERLRSAWIAICTSVAEGFGLTFLEPWLVNRPVVGRKIPGITTEFEEAGVDLSELYERLLIPLDWLDKDALLERMRTVYESLLATYNRVPRPGDVECALDAAITDGAIDFGRLDEDFQEQVILKLMSSQELRKDLAPNSLIPDGGMKERISKNKKLIERVYSLDNYADRLMTVYQAVANSETSEVDHGLDVNRLLDAFLSPENFYLLRT